MDINDRPVGVFDSGMGGLTAVHELQKILPHEDIIYLGDTARLPYGTKSRETILRYAAQDFAFLKRLDVKYIIAACGTVSSVIAADSSFKDRMCTGVIEPTVAAAVEATKNKKIGVIATSASVRSQSYEKLIKLAMPEAEVYSKACPMFVPLVENGFTAADCEPTVYFAKKYLEPLRDIGVDVLILGCTHYPLLADVITSVVGKNVRLISSGAEAARRAKDVLCQSGLLSSRTAPGNIKLYCTDSPELFKECAENFLNIDGTEVNRCSVE